MSPITHPGPGDQLDICLNAHNLAVITWNSEFDIDAAIADCESRHNRQVTPEVRSELEIIQQAVDYEETLLVGTEGNFKRPTGNKDLDDAIVQILCGEVVEYGVGKGTKAAAKKVGKWAKGRFPTGLITKKLLKVNVILSFAETLFGVAYENLLKNAACN